MKYRKKPVVIEAVQFNEYYAAMGWGNDIPTWLAKAYENKTVEDSISAKCIYIKTLEGTMSADVGDWIIQGVKGEIYPCKPDIFAATYEAVEEPEIKEGDHQLNIDWEKTVEERNENG